MLAEPKMLLQPDVNELILCNDKNYKCETYIFEPSSAEQSLGRLLAVAETEERNGVGSELLDLAMTAIQREYYRDPSRGIVASFESALHQANLVLHDAYEQGVRDWMGYFNVVVAVLANTVLHISVSGEGSALLCRRAHVTNISYGLSHLPISNPLRTFSQVASGTIAARDILFFGTSQFDTTFPDTDLVRLSVDHSASTIGLRLRQLYTDRKMQIPVAALTVSILPQHISEPRREVGNESRRRSATAVPVPPLRKPLIIHTSKLRNIIALAYHLMMSVWQFILKQVRWLMSFVSSTLHKRKQAVTETETETDSSASLVSRIAAVRQPLKDWPSLPKNIINRLRSGFSHLPRSSKIFAILTIVLCVAFLSSLLLLRHRRAEDQQIQRASEILHEAQTKQEAAASALIYNNREQARQLLDQADQLTQQLKTTGLYANEAQNLSQTIEQERDRLQRIVRVASDKSTVLADIGSTLKNAAPQHIFFVNNALYSYNPSTNAIIKIDVNGTISTVRESTEGVGFFIDGVAHEADKTIILLTKDPGIAIFDTKDNTVAKQDISFPAAQPEVLALVPFGNRLYLYDHATKNIYTYSKSLRGYSSGDPWIKTTDFSADTIRSIAIDGSIYTLHTNGQVNKLFKGEKAELKLDTIQPALSAPTRIMTTDEAKNLYILDPSEKRVVIFDKKGVLQRQIYVNNTTALTDLALSPDEKKLYLLDGTKILAVNLAE